MNIQRTFEGEAGIVPTSLHVENISKVFISQGGVVVPALSDVTLEIGAGEVAALIGPSGCGKSSLLRILAGLDDDYQGRISWPATTGARDRLPSATVFQGDSTLPWMTVEQNIYIGMRGLTLPKSEIRARADRYLSLVGLAEFRRAYPHELSGGMRQRLAIARALATEPHLLLMDEPLAALDAQTRLVMQQELLAMWRQIRVSVVYVTHDIAEALTLADRVIVMSRRPGRIKCIQRIPFPRERDALEIRRLREFGELEVDLWRLVAEEVGADLRLTEAQR